MRLKVLSFFIPLMVALSACGIKPAKVDPPPSVKVDKFPRVYPNPATDPKPARPATP